MDTIQEWLNLVEITYTLGTVGMNWTNIMEAARDDDRFWYDTDHDGNKKSAGWKFLALEDDDEEEGEGGGDEEEEDSEYGSDDEDSEEESSEGEFALSFVLSAHPAFFLALLTRLL